ncbi:hypothetical protein BFO_2748 [Tannerella forsythia 92A2]|uniref:Uncharacterized protein n=1 Tax=Tannerella forsythia (strain ATCC 43037 / JCM 10827 / CCUG 21028 A / KCTC 5666 / FDC 338) TaxID=203275 RepID=G8UMR6_TANFA|nr:hypothetical protein BFO_2748 [Tannerella forsythia 92A2]
MSDIGNTSFRVKKRIFFSYYLKLVLLEVVSRERGGLFFSA